MVYTTHRVRPTGTGVVRIHPVADDGNVGRKALARAQPGIVGAKVAIPSPGGYFRLLPRALNALASKPIGLISAPAGFGKTSTAAAWAIAEERRGARVAWLRCDASDAALEVFAQDLATALTRPLRGLVLLPSPPGELPPALANRLAATVEQIALPVRLVLDDVHALPAESPAWAVLAALGEVLPPNMHLMLVAREEPLPLPVARWRGRDRLAHCTSADLRLPPDAVATVLSDRLQSVPAAVAQRAAQLTGGWPILVALLSEWLNQIPRSEWTAALSGVPRLDLVAQYFGSEVLSAMDARQRRFLLVTSVMNVLDPGAVAAIWPDADGPPLLERLSRSAFFTVLDARAMRLQHHDLFAAFLREEAYRELGPDTLRHIRVALAHHAAEAGDPERAVQHALAAGEWALASRILAQVTYALLSAGSLRSLEEPLGQLPERVRQSDPYALLVEAHLAAGRGDAVRAAAYAGEGLQLALAAGDADAAVAAVAHLADALPGSEADRTIVRRLTAHANPRVAGWGRLWQLKLDLDRVQPGEIQAVLRDLEAVETSADLIEEARLTAGWLLYMTGALAEIRITPEAYVRALGRQRFDPFPAYLYAGRWDELATLLAATRAVEPPPWAAGHVRVWLNVPEAILAVVRGDIGRADDLLVDVERAYGSGGGGFVRPEFLSVYHAVRAGTALRAGRREEALALLRANVLLHTNDPVMHPVTQLDLAQAHASVGDAAAARRALFDARELADDRGLRGLYYRLLRVAILGGDPWAVMQDIQDLGAFGFLPLYDPGPLRQALQAARAAGQVPEHLRETVDHVLDLCARGDTHVTEPSPPALAVRTFGGFAAEFAGSRLPSPGPRVAELFIRLVQSGGEPLPRAELAEAMWPETARDTQTNRMRVTLHALRRWLTGAGCGDRLHATRREVGLQAGAWLDWDFAAWRQAVLSLRRTATPSLAAHRSVLGLYRGPLLPEVDFHEAFYYEREQCALEHSHLARRAAELAPDDSTGLEILEGAVTVNPGDEALVSALIRRLSERGDRARARLVAAAWREAAGTPLPESIQALIRRGPGHAQHPQA